jgi:Branched-chain amino acid transport system / permease component
MTTATAHAGGRRFFSFARDHITYGIFALITLYFIAFAPHFASFATAGAVLRITAIVSVMTIGMTFVIVCGEIDLSVGSLASFAGMIVAMLYERDVPSFVAPVIVLALGALVGSVSGLLVTKIRIPSFMVTLGMLSIFSGLALTVTDTRPVPILDDTFSALFWNGSFLGVQAPILWTVALTALGYYLPHQMPFGSQDLRDRRKSNRGAVLRGQDGPDEDRRLCHLERHCVACGHDARHTLNCRQPQLGRWTRARRDPGRDHRRHQFVWRLRFDRRLSGRRDLYWHPRIRSSGHGAVDQHPRSHQGRDHHSGGVGEPSVAGYAPRRFWFSESNSTARKITAP